MHSSGTAWRHPQPGVSMVMSNYSLARKALFYIWDTDDFCPGVCGNSEPGRKERREKEKWTGCGRHQNTKRILSRKWDSSVLNDVGCFQWWQFLRQSFFLLEEVRKHTFPSYNPLQPSPGLLVPTCTPSTKPCSKKQDAELLDCPLNPLASWFLLAFGTGRWECGNRERQMYIFPVALPMVLVVAEGLCDSSLHRPSQHWIPVTPFPPSAHSSWRDVTVSVTMSL